MSIFHIIIILVTILRPASSSANVDDDKDTVIVNVTMNNYQSTKEDQIVFIQYKLPDEELTIIGYTPLVTTPTAHHMNTVACESPGSSESFWTSGTVCGPGAQMLLYGWDRDALPFHFPEEIGTAVGKNTPYKYIVVNIHYLPIVKNDFSGNQFIFSRKRRKYLAGVVTGGAASISLPPRTLAIKTPFSCQYNGLKISIFAVGVHAHQWARVNSLYRVRDGNITLILKGDPQQTHQSYLLLSPIEILDGDYLVGQCVFDNDEDRVITMGLTHNDEMCNVMAGYFYELNDDKQLNGRVPLETCWGNEFSHLIALIPPDSEIPLTKSADQGENIDTKHTVAVSRDHPTHTDRKTIDFHSKTFYMFVITIIIFGIAVLLIVIIVFLICMKSLHGSNCLERLFGNRLCFDLNRCWIFSRWFNRGDGFKELEQFSDEENELVDNEV